MHFHDVLYTQLLSLGILMAPDRYNYVASPLVYLDRGIYLVGGSITAVVEIVSGGVMILGHYCLNKHYTPPGVRL